MEVLRAHPEIYLFHNVSFWQQPSPSHPTSQTNEIFSHWEESIVPNPSSQYFQLGGTQPGLCDHFPSLKIRGFSCRELFPPHPFSGFLPPKHEQRNTGNGCMASQKGNEITKSRFWGKISPDLSNHNQITPTTYCRVSGNISRKQFIYFTSLWRCWCLSGS